MAVNYLLFGLFFVICLNNVRSNVLLFNDYELPTSMNEKCTKACNENYKPSNDIFISAALSSDSEICARGCRFFSISKMLTEKSFGGTNIALDTCYACCDDSYVDTNRKICRNGCESMLKLSAEPVIVRSSFSLSIFMAADSDEQGVQSTGDIEPDYVLTDPALRSQLSANVIDNTKLPEMKVKTLPIDSDKLDGSVNGNEKESLSSSSDCLRWILQTFHIPTCLFAAMLALPAAYLCARFLFSCVVHKHGLHSSSSLSSFNDDMNASLTKSVFSSPGKSAPIAVFLDKNDTLSKGQMEVIVPNIHKVPPPKYDDAVMNDEENLMNKNAVSSPSTVA